MRLEENNRDTHLLQPCLKGVAEKRPNIEERNIQIILWKPFMKE